MTRRNHKAARGTVQRLMIQSIVLRSNLLSDPTERAVDVHLPPGYQPGQSLPLLVDLVGFTGSGMSHTNWRNFGENVP